MNIPLFVEDEGQNELPSLLNKPSLPPLMGESIWPEEPVEERPQYHVAAASFADTQNMWCPKIKQDEIPEQYRTQFWKAIDFLSIIPPDQRPHLVAVILCSHDRWSVRYAEVNYEWGEEPYIEAATSHSPWNSRNDWYGRAVMLKSIGHS